MKVRNIPETFMPETPVGGRSSVPAAESQQPLDPPPPLSSFARAPIGTGRQELESPAAEPTEHTHSLTHEEEE